MSTNKIPWSAVPLSRLYLENVLLPSLADHQPMLFVGVANFTDHYRRCVAEDADFTTIDIKPEASGSKPDIVVDITSTDFVSEMRRRGLSFQSVVFNGILGYGVNDPHSARAAFENINAVLRPGGKLLVGWNEWACNRNDLIEMLREVGYCIETIEGKEVFGGKGDWDNETRVSWRKRFKHTIKKALGWKPPPLPQPRLHHFLLASGGSASSKSAA